MTGPLQKKKEKRKRKKNNGSMKLLGGEGPCLHKTSPPIPSPLPLGGAWYSGYRKNDGIENVTNKSFNYQNNAVHVRCTTWYIFAILCTTAT